jgi:hypothetical protein
MKPIGVRSVPQKMRELTRNARLVFDYLRITKNACASARLRNKGSPGLPNRISRPLQPLGPSDETSPLARQDSAIISTPHDPKPLKEAYERLQKEHPESEWTKRALPYRLIP